MFYVTENEKLTFHVTSSRSVEEAPTIQVTFANGVKDDLVLSHYKMNENAVIGCNYIGHLRIGKMEHFKRLCDFTVTKSLKVGAYI